MKKFLVLLSTAAAVFALSSCSMAYVSLEPEANQTWVGKPHSEIVSTYGAPTRETSDGQNGKILIYEQTTYVETAVANSNPTFGPYSGLYGFYFHMAEPVHTSYTSETEEHVDYAHFFIDSKGICYQVKTNLERPATKEDKKER